MGRDPRYLPRPGALVEITAKTAQNRYLFRPGPCFNERFIGVLAKAQEVTGMAIHAVVVMSTHFHLLASPSTVEQMAAFMRHVNTNLSKEIGRLYDWTGALFAARYTSIPVSDEAEAQIGRLRYLLQQGTKENLVLTPGDWPGVHCVAALTTGAPLRGVWIDRTKIWAAKQLGRTMTDDDAGEKLTLDLSPLPCWAHLESNAYRRRVAEIVETIEAETIARHRREGTVPSGARWVLRQHPHTRHRSAVSSPRPRFHTVRKSVRSAIREAYATFLAAYRRAADLLREGNTEARFPENCFPPRLPFVPPRELFQPG